jgi:PhnB protein
MTKAKAVPQGMHTLTVQLAVDGADAAIAFYKRAFGAEEIARSPDPSGTKIWHAELRIGDSAIYLNDVFPEMGGMARPASLWLYTEGVDQLFKRATDAGCTVTMPLSDMFWGDRTGQVVDRWGVQWNLAERIKDLTPEEMKKAQDEFVASLPKR